MTRKRAFFYHYNKPASAARGKPQISVHWKGTCHICDNFVCNVATAGRIRKTQPRCVVAGKAADITFKDGIAYIN